MMTHSCERKREQKLAVKTNSQITKARKAAHPKAAFKKPNRRGRKAMVYNKFVDIKAQEIAA